VARRRKRPSKVDLQAVLRYLADANGPEYQALVAWIEQTFGCRERAAKDNVAILVKGNWVEALPLPSDRRRKRYVLTEKGRADMRGSFGQGALARGRRRHSTCLSGTGRRRQAAQRAAGRNELAEVLEAERRYLFAGRTNADLIQALGGPGRLLPLHSQRRKPSPFRARLQAELLGEGHRDPRGEAPRSDFFRARLQAELLGEGHRDPRGEAPRSDFFRARLQAELLGEGHPVREWSHLGQTPNRNDP
jgi:hypothetical protein